MKNPDVLPVCLDLTSGGPLLRWDLKGRERRFFMLGMNTGEVAHCANTGSLKGCLEDAVAVWVKDLGESPTRKLRYSAQLLELKDGSCVGIQTGHANTLAGMWLAGQLSNLKAEAKWDSATRFDFYGEDADSRPVWVEVKNVSMAAEVNGQRVAMFPDAKTERGVKHLQILTEIAQSGGQAWQLYVVQRGDCTDFRPADAIDPAYGRALRAAAQAGVRIVALACNVTPKAIKVARELPVVLD